VFLKPPVFSSGEELSFPHPAGLELSSAIITQQPHGLQHSSQIKVGEASKGVKTNRNWLYLKVKGRVQTSTAMIGLALSVGTSSLLLPQQSRRVLADELPPLDLSASKATPQVFPVSLASPFPAVVSLALSPSTQSQEIELAPELLPNVAVQVENTASSVGESVSTELQPFVALNQAPEPETSKSDAQAPALVNQANQPVEQSIFVLNESVVSQPEPSPLPTPNFTLSLTPAPTPLASPTLLPGDGNNVPQQGIIQNELALHPQTVPTSSQPQLVQQPQSVQLPEHEEQMGSRLGDFTGSRLPVQVASTIPVALNPLNPLSDQLSSTEFTLHQVHSGDTLKEIAKVYGVSETVLVEANQLSNPDLIQASQVLKVPQTVTEPVSTLQPVAIAPVLSGKVGAELQQTESDVYRVNPGDTLSAIARKHGVSIEALMLVNNLSNPNYIEVWQQIKLPSTTVAETSSVSATPQKLNKFSLVAANPEAVSDVATVTVDPYIEDLKSEIQTLQSRYQQLSDQPISIASLPSAEVASAVKPVSGTSGLPVQPKNPEFMPTAATQSGLKSRTIAQVPSAAQSSVGGSYAEPVDSVQTRSRQVVATSSLQPDAYAPTVGSQVGRQVSPELPPLAAAETYLPGSSSKFKGYVWPAKGVLTSGYGWRWGRMHRGIDIAAPIGTPVVSVASGVVEVAGWNPGGYGNLVDIRHPDGSLTRYGHNDRILVRAGQYVEQGQQIAEMGSTGFSTGPHCHFEVHPAGQGATNPIAFLPQVGRS
jgi:murein DD-endopeptidase MepM/ murein hydrolase activator NlpD